MTKLLRSVKLLVAILAALTLVTPAVAQGQGAVLTGRVVSDQGQPLAGANVQVPELSISVATNQAGVFTIDVPAGRVRGQPVTVRARAIGYQPSTSPVALTPGSQTVDFNLKKELTELTRFPSYREKFRARRSFQRRDVRERRLQSYCAAPFR